MALEQLIFYSFGAFIGGLLIFPIVSQVVMIPLWWLKPLSRKYTVAMVIAYAFAVFMRGFGEGRGGFEARLAQLPENLSPLVDLPAAILVLLVYLRRAKRKSGTPSN